MRIMKSSGRPAHPDQHDRRIIDMLEQCVHNEVLVPCTDEGAVKLFRSRIREIIRAHAVWETGRAKEFKNVRTKRALTTTVMAIRSEYSPDPIRTPITLILDGREKLQEMLEGVTVSGTPYPMVGPANLSRADDDAAKPEEDEDDVDPYMVLTNRYARKPA